MTIGVNTAHFDWFASNDQILICGVIYADDKMPDVHKKIMRLFIKKLSWRTGLNDI